MDLHGFPVWGRKVFNVKSLTDSSGAVCKEREAVGEDYRAWEPVSDDSPISTKLSVTSTKSLLPKSQHFFSCSLGIHLLTYWW